LAFAQGLRVIRTRMDEVAKASGAKNKKLNEQTDAVQRDTRASALLQDLYRSLRIAIGVLIARGISELTSAMIRSTDEAREFSKRISEIQTITLETSNGLLRSAKTTEQWKTELQALSRTFGIPTLETTEALYQALSNQVVQAGNSTSFLTEEMKLAITTVSTLDQAVETTSTVINAFGKRTSEAARINAVLFKAVDLGRFRLEELGSQFGRVSVLSKDLGISFEEQAGAIALLTRLGLKADVAQTLLTNVQLHLIKPTKDMVELFKQWGVNSGEAAIRTFGFSGVMRKLAEETTKGVDATKEISDLFQDLRAITGAQGLVSNFSQLQNTINQVSSATAAYNKAFSLTLDSLGRKADIELEKLRQQLLNSFGEPILRALVTFAQSMGGADKALVSIVATGRQAVEVYIGYRTALLAISTAQTLANASTGQFTIFLQRNTAAANATRASLIALTATEAAFTAGLSLLAVGIGELITESATIGQRLESSFTSLRSNLLEAFRKDLEATINKIDEFAVKTERSNQTVFSSYFRVVAHVRSLTSALTEDFEKKFKKIRDVMVDGLKVSTSALEDRFKELQKNIDKVTKALDDLRERAIKVRAEAEDKAFGTGLVGKSDEDALKLTIDRKRKLDADALTALRKGELDLADELFRRSERLADDAEKRIEDLKRKVIKDADEISTRVSSTGSRSISVRSGDTESTAFVTAPGRPRFGAIFPRGAGLPAGEAARIFGISGRPARAGTVVRRTEEIVDTKTLTVLEGTLKKLREESAKIERDKLAAIEAGIKAKDTEKAKLEAEVKIRERDLAAFKAAVAEIDAFDTKSPDAFKKFDALLKSAETTGKTAGLSPAEQLQFLRQANATRLLLERDARTKAISAAADIEEKAISEAEKKTKDSLARRADAAKKAQEQIGAVAIQNIEAAARIRAEFQRPGFFKVGEITGGFDKEDVDRINKQKQTLITALDTFEKLNQKLLDVRKSGGDVAGVLAEIAAQQKKVDTLINDFNTNRQITGRVGRGRTLDRNASGQILFERQPGQAEESLSSVIQQSGVALDKIKASFNEAKAAADDFSKAQATLEQLRNTLATIPKPIRDVIEESKVAAAATLTAEEAIQKVYDGTLSRLLKQIEALKEIAALKEKEKVLLDAAGPVVPRAGGGLIGTDRTLVALSGGETVMNRLATRQWSPILRALNAAPPQFRASGGEVFNFHGDIHIQPTSTTSTSQAYEIAQKLTRLNRRGLYAQ